GLVWLAFWIPLYAKPSEHKRLTKAEFEYINSDVPDEVGARVPWLKLIPLRETTAFAVGKYMTDPIWWFYLYWIPNFLRERHGLELSTIGLPLVVIYVVADIGSIGGGWMSSALIKRGWSVNRARKTTMLTCALAVTPIVFASRVQSLWMAVALISLAAAAHQGWSANLFTMVSDMFPRRAVGSVVGIGGMAGAFAGATMAVIVGYILEVTHSDYRIPFAIASFAYLAALLLIHLLVPRLQQVRSPDAIIAKPFSLGTITGFGFVGGIFGAFGGWCVGLLAHALGSGLLEYMASGAALGVVVGIVSGVLITNAGQPRT
ncbi:MAG: MFS transporter, partial [Gemmatimonadaceae bacterium]